MVPDGFGLLHLSREMPPALQEAPRWLDDKGIAAALAVAVVLYMAGVPLLCRTLPELGKCVFRQHSPSAFEHSIQKSRSRNWLCILTLPLDCLLIDRLGLYCPSYSASLPHWWRIAVIPAALLVYLGIRALMFSFFRFHRLRSDDIHALRNNILSVWLWFSCLYAPVAFILLRLGVPDSDLRTISLAAAGFFLLMSYWRSAQILKNQCGIFSTFLYLCALEFAPVSLLILSAGAL